MAFDYKKEYREFYMLPKKPGIVDVPEMHFILLAKRHMNEEKSWEHRSQLFIAIMVYFFKLFILLIIMNKNFFTNIYCFLLSS